MSKTWNRSGERWSSSRQLLGKTETPGQWVELEFVAPDNSPRTLVVYATQLRDYATLRFQINDEDISQRLDGFAPEVQPATALTPGTFASRDGKFQLRVEVAGANSASTGAKYFWCLDCVKLEKP